MVSDLLNFFSESDTVIYGAREHGGFCDWLTLRRPSRRKLRMRWFIDVCKVKEEKSDLTDPPRFFMRIF